MNHKGQLLVNAIGEGYLLIFVVHQMVELGMRLDQEFRHIFVPHGDLQCLRRFPSRAFSVLPSCQEGCQPDGPLPLIIPRTAIVHLMLDPVESSWKHRRHL